MTHLAEGGVLVRDLSYACGSRHAPQGVSFEVAPGGFCALLGPNGAGKSTLYALLTRLVTAPRGEIRIAGVDLARHPGRRSPGWAWCSSSRRSTST